MSSMSQEMKDPDKNRIVFFMDALEEMMHYQTKENKISNVEAIGCLVVKVLDIWDDLRQEEDESP